jgi:hypothetical protein
VKKQTSNVETLTADSQLVGWHNSNMRRDYRGEVRRPAVGLALVALVTACVTIAPTPTNTPTQTPVPVTTRPSAPQTPDSTPSGAQTPTPISTPGGPATPPPSGPGTPGPTIDPQLAAQIEEVIAQVPPIRGLEPLSPVPYEFISREQFRDELIDLQFSEIPEETRQAEERLLKRLGLLPDDVDLDQLLIDLYGAQVAAYYRPDTKRFYIIQRDQPFGPSDKIIVAHEYTHALQDQHFDLEGTRIKDLSEGDAVLAQLAAVEGDATKTMQQWTVDNLSPEEAFQVLFESFGQLADPTLTSMPWILRRQLEFPYAEGLGFAESLHAIGGFDAIDATLSDAIPASTEQILHPEKYTANEEPVDVAVPDLTAQLGDGWSSVFQQTMGEAVMQVWAAGDEEPSQLLPGTVAEWPHADSVAGWGGDRLVMYENDEDDWAIVWFTEWDTDGDGLEFRARSSELARGFEAMSVLGELPGGDVQIVVASDVAINSTLNNALGQ